MNNNSWIKYTGIFILGVVVGLASGAWGVRHMFEKGFKKDPTQRILHKLDKDLKLTTDQHDKVALILDENRKKMETLRVTAEPKMEEMRKTMETKFEALKMQGEDSIRAVLIPEQAKKFDEIKTRWEKSHSKKMWRHAGPLPMPGCSPSPGKQPAGK